MSDRIGETAELAEAERNSLIEFARRAVEADDGMQLPGWDREKDACSRCGNRSVAHYCQPFEALRSQMSDALAGMREVLANA